MRVSTFTLSEVHEVALFEVGSGKRFRRVVERAGTGTCERVRSVGRLSVRRQAIAFGGTDEFVGGSQSMEPGVESRLSHAAVLLQLWNEQRMIDLA